VFERESVCVFVETELFSFTTIIQRAHMTVHYIYTYIYIYIYAYMYMYM